MADKVRFFRTYWEGMNLTAMIRRGLSGYALDVEYIDYDGKKHPYADYHYKDERGAERGLKTRFRGAEWVEIT